MFWEHAQLVADWRERDLTMYVKFYQKGALKREYGPEPKSIDDHGRSKQEVAKLTNSDMWAWFDDKIVELGQDGWELVSAPNMSISVSRVSDLGVTGWQLWFKRPARDEKSKEEK